ncbi:adenine nucleotide alpha hydrolase family protein [Metallosphaera tengchongensis]|uniref:Adenine nucleotide alpha hydrolase family protein n=1 Tax=Metallosphaera tengchongensis TaxID=1532350 RepID=A0A6N0NVI6_9CREN|nr:ATP-binding protein [Metallosphaera tengchongensis]QKQ99169.1 adenine nucleotide alpha hydrolase family protein [Metallosphaera tengchongensis]
MYCKKCNSKAVIRVHFNSLPLCATHFSEWFESKVEKTIVDYNMIQRHETVGVAVSGGKDSSTLLHVLSKLSTKLGFDLVGINIDLGIDGGTQYSSLSTQMAIKNFELTGVRYKVLKLKESYGFSIDEAKTRIRRPVCSTCGLVKRYVLEEVAKGLGANVLATGHNLNDMAQFVMAGYHTGDLQNLARLRAVLPAENGYLKKVKPLFLSSEKEIMTYALMNKIPFMVDSCPNNRRVGGPTSDKLRKMLEATEDEIPGFMTRLVENFEKRIRPFFEDLPKYNLGKCKICGKPTNSDREICSFCALKIKMGGAKENVT